MTNNNFLRGKQVVFLASIDWGATWQRHQALSEAFTRAGAEVFFVENTGFRGFSPADFSRVLNRVTRFFRPSRRRKNRRVISPLVLPPTLPVFRLLNAVYFIPLLLSKLKKRGLRESSTVFAYLPTETTLRLLDGLDPETVVYDCVDNFYGHPSPPQDLAATEANLLERSALVLTTSSFLETQKKALHPNVRRIHHGVDPAFLSRRFPPSTEFKRFCYFGTVWNALDYEALRALASDGRTVDLIGPVKESVPPLGDSIRLLPPVPRDHLPEILMDYDALVLPYARTEYNKGVVPAKLYECLATGKPILCSALPSLLEFGELIELAKRPSDFPKIATALPSTESDAKRKKRLSAAAGHSTDRQVELIEAALLACSRTHARKDIPAPLPAAEFFLKGFSWIALWFITARVASILTQFAAARWLGPEAFGRAHLVIAIAALLQTVVSLGFPLAMARFTGSAETRSARKKIVSTAFICFCAWAAFATAILLILGDSLSWLAELDIRLWWFCAALGGLSAVHHTLGGALQGLNRFLQRGIAESTYALGALAAICVAILLRPPSTEILIIGLIAGLILAIIYGLFQIRKQLIMSLDRPLMREILPFAVLGSVNLLAISLIQAPGRIAAYHFGSAVEAGIYSIYFMATMQISLALGNMISAVLVPMASRESGQEAVWSVLRGVTAPIAIGIFAAFSIFAAVALTLLGKNYPLNPLWIGLFSCAAVLTLLHGAMASAFAARSLRGLSVSVTGMLIAGIGNAAANLIFTPRWGVAGAGISLILSYAAGLAWFALESPPQLKRSAT